MSPTRDQIPRDEELLFSGVMLLNARALGLALGSICGLVILIATLWLVIKGGDPVGPNLALLSQYFIGYRVSVGGSVIGFFYGFAVGSLAGSLLGWIYNRLARWRHGPP